MTFQSSHYAAFGVGGPRVVELLRELNRDIVAVRAKVRYSPTGAPERAAEKAAKLNVGVGAEHVQRGSCCRSARWRCRPSVARASPA